MELKQKNNSETGGQFCGNFHGNGDIKNKTLQLL